jgi:hypothetical protein
MHGFFKYAFFCSPLLPLLHAHLTPPLLSSSLFSLLTLTQSQVTVAILLNSFVGAITAAEEEAAETAAAGMKSKEMLRCAADMRINVIS